MTVTGSASFFLAISIRLWVFWLFSLPYHSLLRQMAAQKKQQYKMNNIHKCKNTKKQLSAL